MTKAKDGSRRDFLKGASLAGAASLLATQRSSAAHSSPDDQNAEPIHAKNLIFLVADGMGTGTLSLAHHWKQSNEGSILNWMQLYGRPDVVTALQETASASSPVTDSAAAASAWGSGKRVNNRSINIGTDGVPQTPLMTYVKKAGKATGLVSTCRITHATPAGFAANSADRDAEDKIADQYLERGIDVILGGGRRHFDRQGEGQDGKNLLSAFESKGYATALNKESLFAAKGSPKLLGLFSDSHIPYAIDRKFDKSFEAIPSLPEMFQAALKSLESAPNGFVLQVEAGRVDHAGHANDPAAILHDQLEFDDCIPLAIEFAEKNKDTLVIVTTDHGTGGCQLNGAGDSYNGSEASMNQINRFKGSFESLELVFKEKQKFDKDLFEEVTGIKVNKSQGKEIESAAKKRISYLSSKMTDVVAEQLHEATAVGWTSNKHTAEFVEFLCFGPGSSLTKPFMKNYELFHLMARALQLKI